MPPRPGAGDNGTRPTALRARQGGLRREQISHIQRGRLLDAIVKVTAEHGWGDVTVAHIVGRSGVSRRTFYEHFADREECLLAAFDAAVDRIADRVLPAYEREAEWTDRIRSSLVALLEFLEEDPATARLAVVDVLAAGPRALERRQRILSRVVAAVDLGRRECKPDGEPAPLTAEGVVGAVFSVIHTRMLANAHPSLTGLASQLMGMIVLPYLGGSAARREIAKPTPQARPGPEPGLDALRDLEMRLTYRTVCVLVAIGASPGASNRQIADASGIQDQGQVSKLLRRLRGLGLVDTAAQRIKGEANAWSLTALGASVLRAISAQTMRS
jgi:AcrR family transcriptional regulator